MTLKQRKFNKALSLVLVVIVVLLAAMLSGCVDSGTNDSDANNSNPAGTNSGMNIESNSSEGFSLALEEDEEKTIEKDANTSASNGTVIAASSSSGGSKRSSGNNTDGSSDNNSSNDSVVKNRLLGTWTSEETDFGTAITFRADGTFDFGSSSIDDELTDDSAPEKLGRSPSAVDAAGKGAYIYTQNDAGVITVITYFDSGAVTCWEIEMTETGLALTEFTLKDGTKEYGNTYILTGISGSADPAPMELPANIFTENSEYGWGADLSEDGLTFSTVWKFKTDGTVDCTLLGLGEMFGAETNDITFTYVYTVFDDVDDIKDRLIIYGEEDDEAELMIMGYEFDEEEYSMSFKFYSPETNYQEAEDETFAAWAYPMVNVRVIDKENNSGGVMFLSIPISDEWTEQVKIANDNGFIFGHDSAIASESYSIPVTGKTNQITDSGMYNAGFEFNISTTAEESDEVRPAIGFGSYFDFTAENLGTEKYDAFVLKLEELKESGEAESFEGWIMPDASVLNEFGIHVYADADNSGSERDITDKISFGIYTGYDGMLLMSYGAVMVDNELGYEGVPLLVSDEEELIWSDGTEDGYITGKWWIVLESSEVLPTHGFAGGSGTIADPYQIETAAQLDLVRDNLNKHFILTADISLAEYENWEPIGTFIASDPEDDEAPDLEYAFTGTFNGNGYTISDMTINQPEDDAVGLFGTVAGGSSAKVIEINGMNCDNCIRKVTNALSGIEGVINVDVTIGTAIVFLEADVDDDVLMEAVNNAGHYEAQSVSDRIVISIGGMNCPNCITKVTDTLSSVEGVKSVDVVLGRATVIADSEVDSDELWSAVDNAGHYTALAVSSGASVYDLTVENVDVTGFNLVAGVVGYSVGGALDNVDLAGSNTIRGTQMVGGIVGGGLTDLIRCDSEADIIILGDYGGFAGVLAGGMEGCSLINCTAVGTITADGTSVGVGGLAGCVFEGPLVTNCTADVIIRSGGAGSSLIGGLLGFAGTYDDEPTLISNSNVLADIYVSNSASRIGGIVGGGFYSEEFKEYYPVPSKYKVVNCTAEGTITGGSEAIGSIAGHSYESVVEDCVGNMKWIRALEQIGKEETEEDLMPFAGGSGTTDDPYQIETAEQLNRVRYYLDQNFILTADISLADYENWEPIGTYVPLSEDDIEAPLPDAAFTGTFNGNAYIISDVTVSQPEGAAVGLFGCVVGTTIKVIEIDGMNCNNCINKVKNALESVEGVQSAEVVLGTATVFLNEDVSDDVLASAVNEMVNSHYETTSVSSMTTILIDGMNCNNCINKVKTALENIEGVKSADVSLGTVTVTFSSDADLDEMRSAVNNAGHYDVMSMSGPSVYDLWVEDVSVEGMYLAGGVIGYAADCTLVNVNLAGRNTIEGSQMIGGIVGGGFSDLIDCHADANIIVLGDGGNNAGVLAGGLESCSVFDSSAVGTIKAEGNNVYGLGGLAGCVFDGPSVANSTADVIITAGGNGNSLIGGLLGYTGTFDEENPTVVSDSIAKADIYVSKTASRIGGLVGGGFYLEEYKEYYPNPSMFIIIDSSTDGSITGGGEAIGSIVGHAYGSVVENCISTMTRLIELEQIGEKIGEGTIEEEILRRIIEEETEKETIEGETEKEIIKEETEKETIEGETEKEIIEEETEKETIEEETGEEIIG